LYADNNTASQQFITVVDVTAGNGVSLAAEAHRSKSVPDPGPEGFQTIVVPRLSSMEAEVASSTRV
jgi:hypothetical protein